MDIFVVRHPLQVDYNRFSGCASSRSSPCPSLIVQLLCPTSFRIVLWVGRSVVSSLLTAGFLINRTFRWLCQERAREGCTRPSQVDLLETRSSHYAEGCLTFSHSTTRAACTKGHGNYFTLLTNAKFSLPYVILPHFPKETGNINTAVGPKRPKP
jgi:hypothetical protein